jgi:hypothetical protein
LSLRHDACTQPRNSILIAAAIALAVVSIANGQQFHRQTFESNETQLKLGLTNGQIELLEHEITEDRPHGGRRAERLALRVTGGDFALVEYPIDPTMILEELEISAFLCASQPGATIQARVVLPRVPDPETGKPTVTLLTGTRYDAVDRYSKLVLSRLDKLLARQQQLLQAERKESVDVREAYVDQVVFNVLSGTGEYEVRIDDIVVGPIVPRIIRGDASSSTPAPGDEALPLSLRGEDGQMPAAQVPDVAQRGQKLRAEIRAEQLLVGERAFFPRGMARTNAPLRVFQETGLNMVLEPAPIAGPVAEEAAARRLLLIPMLSAVAESAGVDSLANPRNRAATFDDQSVFFYLGGPLDRSNLPRIAEDVKSLRQRDLVGDRIITSDIAESFREYSRQLDMIGAAKFPLLSTLTFEAYERWLRERKLLAVPGSILWSWIQTHPPREYVRLVHGHDLDEKPFEVPVGPTPAQIRLLTYAALAGGSRGVVFTSDRWLGESTKGRARTLGLAVLNAELTLIEPFIADGHAPVLRPTSHPNIKAAIFKHNAGRGVLALLYWSDPLCQFSVGQASQNNVQVIVPAPESSQAFEICPYEVRGVKRRRDVGGIRVTIDEFDSVAFIVLTTDAKLYANYQESVVQWASQATTWTNEWAQIELADTETVAARIDAAGHPSREASRWLADARDQVKDAKTALDQKDFRRASLSALRSMRHAREAQRTYWQAAVNRTESAVASPFAASFLSLPGHYAFLDQIRSTSFAGNRLQGGDFELPGNLDAVGWDFDPHAPEEVDVAARLIPSTDASRGKALEIRVSPKGEPPTVLDGARVAVVSPPVRGEAGQTARIRCRVRIPQQIQGSVDGALLFDSLGGESLALRVIDAADWKSFEWHRPVVESSEIRFHIVMTGQGSVELDDVAIELGSADSAPVAEKPGPNRNR